MSAFLRWCFWKSISPLDRESPLKDKLYSRSQCVSPLSLSLSFLIGIIFKRWLADSKLQSVFQLHSVQFTHLVVSDSLQPMNCSMPGLPVHHQLLEFTQNHVRLAGDAIQPSHPLSSPSPPVPNPSQHLGLLQWVNSSHEVAKVLEFQLQHQSFQLIFRTDFL